MAQANSLVVTAAEFARQFGSLRQSRNDTIAITHHGRETHVLLTVHRYQGLLEQTFSREERGSVLNLEELIGWINQGFIALAPDFTVLMANGIAHAMLEQPDGQLVGRNFGEAVPRLQGSLAEGYIRRAMEGGQKSSADLPAIAREGRWTHLEVFPTAENTIVLLRDITEDVRRNRLADTKKAIVEAINLHGDIGYLRVGARGQIERAEPTICKMLKLGESRLRDVSIADLVPIQSRVKFREVLEPVLRGQGSCRFETEFMVNDGSVVEICGAMTELRGAYGSEGAVIIVTRKN